MAAFLRLEDILAIRRHGKRQRRQRTEPKHRINDQIWAKELRVVDEGGEDRGILPVQEALAIAKQSKLDLVEVAPNAKPPVAKIMNYGKYKFEQEKREREARKKQKASSLKEVKLRPKIGDHDREFKIGHGIEFLRAGHKLKVTVMFSGREMAHQEIGRELLDLVKGDLLEHGKVEAPPKMEGRNLSMTIAPKQGLGVVLDDEDEIEGEEESQESQSEAVN